MKTSAHTFIKLRRQVLQMLETELPPELTYHGFHHTKDVLKVCRAYLRREKITGYEAHILKLAAAVHDIGFIHTYKDHELVGAEMTANMMREYGFYSVEIERIKKLIMATKVPQSPGNQLERILCDADLDYLGRDDFQPISQSLFVELKNHNLIHSLREWNEIQVKFLSAHTYHTEFALRNRQKKKAMQLERIKSLLSES